MKTKCPEFSLLDYCQGNIPESRNKKLEKHLAGCRKCREEADGFSSGFALASDSVLTDALARDGIEVVMEQMLTGEQARKAENSWKKIWPRLQKSLEDKATRKTRSATSEKDMASRIGGLRQEIRKHPKTPVDWFQLANELKRDCVFKEAASLAPYIKDILGNIYLCSRHPKMAVAAFKEADRLQERKKEGPARSASPRVKKGKSPAQLREDALAVEKLLIRNPENVGRRMALGKLYFDMGRYDEAGLHCEKAASAGREIRDIDFWYVLGRIYVKKKKLARAEECFEKMISLDPKGRKGMLDEALHELSMVYRMKGHFGKARETGLKAALMDPKPEYWVELGETHFQQQDWSEAEKAAKKALKLDPENGQALALAAKAVLKKEDYPRAHEYMEKLANLEPDNFQHYRTLAEIYKKLELSLSMEEALKRAEELEPKTGRANAAALDHATGKGFITTIDCTAGDGDPDFKVSGHLGEILKSSLDAIKEFLGGHGGEMGLPSLAKLDVFIKFSSPEVLSDGPSSGLPILVALVSAIKKTPLSPQDVFMGEVTIHGEIEKIGGAREKIEAAIAAGKRRVFLPAENMDDLTEEERTGFEERIELVPIKIFQDLFVKIF
jgi:tetratricopeptide (TPR) repeat protein